MVMENHEYGYDFNPVGTPEIRKQSMSDSLEALKREGIDVTGVKPYPKHGLLYFTPESFDTDIRSRIDAIIKQIAPKATLIEKQ